MGYYSVIILTPKNQTRLDYRSETTYFGEDERLMQVRFYEAVRKAQTMPAAEVVVVWHDGKQIVRVSNPIAEARGLPQALAKTCICWAYSPGWHVHYADQLTRAYLVNVIDEWIGTVQMTLPV